MGRWIACLVTVLALMAGGKARAAGAVEPPDPHNAMVMTLMRLNGAALIAHLELTYELAGETGSAPLPAARLAKVVSLVSEMYHVSFHMYDDLHGVYLPVLDGATGATITPVIDAAWKGVEDFHNFYWSDAAKKEGELAYLDVAALKARLPELKTTLVKVNHTLSSVYHWHPVPPAAAVTR